MPVGQTCPLSNWPGKISANSVWLNKVSKKLTDAGVIDCAIYDTTLDSDGGAWRFNVQHTSWYNELLGTDRRGIRQSFPQIVLITISTHWLTLYDADDGDLAVWMIFTTIPYGMLNMNNALEGGLYTVQMKNGSLFIGRAIEFGGYTEIDFINDSAHMRNAAAHIRYNGKIANREDALGGEDLGNSSDDILSNDQVCKISLLVHPQSPINLRTGVPYVQVWIGTKDSTELINPPDAPGTVVSGSTVGTWEVWVNSVDFNKNLWAAARFSNYHGLQKLASYPYDTIEEIGNPAVHEGYPRIGIRWFDGVNSAWPYLDSGFMEDVFSHPLKAEHYVTSHRHFEYNANGGLTIIYENPSNYESGSVQYISDFYNTGVIHSPAELSCLNDTYVGALTSGNKVQNGDFTGTGNITNWTLLGDTVNNNGADILDLTSGTQSELLEQELTGLIPNVMYQIKFTLLDPSDPVAVFIREWMWAEYFSTPVTHNQSFIARSETATLLIKADDIGKNIRLDNVIVRPMIADRSRKQDGIAITGSLNFDPVMPGADVCCVSGFALNSNYGVRGTDTIDLLAQDVHISGWVWQPPETGTFEVIVAARKSSEDTDGTNLLEVRSDAGKIGFTLNQSSGVPVMPESVFNRWIKFDAVRRNSDGMRTLYIDGKLVDQSDSGTIASDHRGGLWLGQSPSANSAIHLKIALLNISTGIPTEAEIDRNYQLERHIFEENAKTVLPSYHCREVSYDVVSQQIVVGTDAGMCRVRDSLVEIINDPNITDNKVSQVAGHREGYIAVTPAEAVAYRPVASLLDSIVPPGSMPLPQWFHGDGSTPVDTFELPCGFVPYLVFDNGVIISPETAYSTVFDGICWKIVLNTPSTNNVCIVCMRVMQ